MKKFIEIALIFIIIVVIATLLAMLFGLVLDRQQKTALIILGSGGFFLALYKLILEVQEGV